MQPVVELGLGSSPSDPNPTWTDVTEYVRVSDGIGVQRGRTGDGLQITPGTGTLTFDNTDQRFDPDNASSPYYPDLVDRTPIRIRGDHTTTETVWRGVVEAWPQIDDDEDSVVEVDCLDILGVLAQSKTPDTALAALVALDPPDHWWRPGEQGWVDVRSNLIGRHTSRLDPFDSGHETFQPIAEGDAQTWGQMQADGWAVISSPDASVNVPSYFGLVSLGCQLPANRQIDTVLGIPLPVVLVCQRATVTAPRVGRKTYSITATHEGVSVFMEDGTNSGAYVFENVNLFDGSPHHVAVMSWGPYGLGTNECYLWVDGAWCGPPDASFTGGGTATVTLGPLQFGQGTSTSVYDGTPYVGIIDHVMVWDEFPNDLYDYSTDPDYPFPFDPFSDDVTPTIDALSTAMRRGWSGQHLDDRIRAIAAGLGISDALGQLDSSGIVTLQGYKSGDTVKMLQTIEDTEQGRVWIDREGLIRFSSRGWAWTDAVSTTAQAVFTDDLSEVGAGVFPYQASDFERVKDPRTVTNVAQVTSEHGRQQTVEDLDSIAVRGRRNAISLSGLLHSSDRQSRAIAEWLLFSRGTTQDRVTSISFYVDDDTAELAQTIDEGWLVEVRRRGTTILGHVAAIAHDIGEHGWRVSLSLDSTRAGRTWFCADTSYTDDPDAVAAF